MGHTQELTPDLERIAAGQAATLLDGVPIGSSLPIDSSSDLCDTLELYIPWLLRQSHPEWETESIDGFFFSSAIRTGERSVVLEGICVLISDQTVTPFALMLSLADTLAFRSVGIRLGEPGQGSLGISGPVTNSGAAQELLSGLPARIDRIQWVYDVSVLP